MELRTFRKKNLLRPDYPTGKADRSGPNGLIGMSGPAQCRWNAGIKLKINDGRVICLLNIIRQIACGYLSDDYKGRSERALGVSRGRGGISGV